MDILEYFNTKYQKQHQEYKEILEYITIQCSQYNDEKLTKVITNCFRLIVDFEESDGSLSNSVALYVLLKYFGYNPELCYGLCITSKGYEVYHAWIELDSKVLDLSVYGLSRWCPYDIEEPTNPVVFEKYEDTKMKYGKWVFDEDWEECEISKTVKKGSFLKYFNDAPHVSLPKGEGMWLLLFVLLDEEYSEKKKKEFENIVKKTNFPYL